MKLSISCLRTQPCPVPAQWTPWQLAPALRPARAHLARSRVLSKPPSAATGDNASYPASEQLSLEEEAAYQEFMAQRKAERKAWRQEVRRRAKFDPMASPRRPGADAVTDASTTGAATGSSAGVVAATTAAAPPPPVPTLSRPRPAAPEATSGTPAAAAVSALRAGMSRPVRPPPSPPGGGGGASDAAAAAAATPIGTDDDGRDVLKAFQRGRRPLQAAASSAKKAEMGIDLEDDADADALDMDGIAAMARKMLEDDDSEGESGDEGGNEAAEADRRSAAAIAAASSSSSSSNARTGGTVRQSVPAAAAAAGAAARRPGVYAPKRKLMPIAQLQRQRAAAAEAAGDATKAAAGQTAAKADDEDATAEEEDDLDWDALEAYEQYEQYVNEVAEDEQRGARAAARRSTSSPSTSRPTPASAPAAAAAAAAASKASSASRNAAAASPRAGAAAPSAGSRRRPPSSSSALDPTDKLDAQLDRWEQLLNFFEVVEKDSRREEERRRRREGEAAALAAAEEEAETARGKAGSGSKAAGTAKAAAPSAPLALQRPGGAAGKTAAAVDSLSLELGGLGLGDAEDEEARGEVEVDWQSLERMFLGDGWEAELSELKAKVEAGAREAEAAMAAQDGGEEAAAEPWRDEVSTLLLGLVEISARRYLGRSLLQPAAPAAEGTTTTTPAAAEGTTAEAAAAATAPAGPLSEEERAVAFWEAPFLLLVQDDSADPLLEYGNRTALAALGLPSFEDATTGLPLAALLDPAHPESQQEWLWATDEVAQRAERTATIPSLRLRGPGPGAAPILATDVTLFRIDSLDEEPIGTALVAASWRRLSAAEAAATEAMAGWAA